MAPGQRVRLRHRAQLRRQAGLVRRLRLVRARDAQRLPRLGPAGHERARHADHALRPDLRLRQQDLGPGQRQGLGRPALLQPPADGHQRPVPREQRRQRRRHRGNGLRRGQGQRRVHDGPEQRGDQQPLRAAHPRHRHQDAAQRRTVGVRHALGAAQEQEPGHPGRSRPTSPRASRSACTRRSTARSAATGCSASSTTRPAT